MEDRQFAEVSILDFLVPEQTDVDIENALGAAESPSGEETGVLSRIPQRTLLYFDEKLTVYTVFRTPYQDERALQRYVSRLNVTVEAHAFSSLNTTSAEAPAAASARDVVWASKLDVTEDPVFVVVGSDEDDDGQDVLLIWKMNAFLSMAIVLHSRAISSRLLDRPRLRLQAPAITFKISAILQPLAAHRDTQEILSGGIPLPNNVLAPLNSSLPSGIPHISLSASRLMPTTRSHQPDSSETISLKVVPRKPFRAIPAISSRLRYHRANGAHASASIIASLELDVPPFAQHPIEVRKAALSYTGGQEQEMICSELLELPATYSARDSAVFLFCLDPDDLPSGQPRSSVRSLDIMVDARAAVSNACRPQIQIRWRQTVDFGVIQQRSARPGNLQRDNRPVSLSLGRHANPGSTDYSMAKTTQLMGANVTASFGGTKTICVGEPFRWTVSIINHSDRTRQFSITVIPKRRAGEGGRNRLRSGSLPGSGSATLADAFVDENALYGTVKAQDLESAHLTCLSPNAQTNAMYPGAIYSTELEFLPLKKGQLHIEAVRITDLETGDAVDVRNLPDMVATETESAG